MHSEIVSIERVDGDEPYLAQNVVRDGTNEKSILAAYTTVYTGCNLSLNWRKLERFQPVWLWKYAWFRRRRRLWWKRSNSCKRRIRQVFKVDERCPGIFNQPTSRENYRTDPIIRKCHKRLVLAARPDHLRLDHPRALSNIAKTILHPKTDELLLLFRYAISQHEIPTLHTERLGHFVETNLFGETD